MKAPSSQTPPKKLQVEQLCLQWITDEGWRSRWKHLLDFLIFSWGEKGRKWMRVSALLSWKGQEIWFPSLANLPKINRNYEHLYGFSTTNGVSPPSLLLPHNQALLGLSYQGFPWLHLPLHHSPLEECLYDLLFEIADKKGPEKEGEETCIHSEMIWSCTMRPRPVPNSHLTFLVDSRSILFTI